MENQGYEKLQNTLFEISTAINTISDLHEIFSRIHELVNTVIDANNFYIALYNTQDRTTRFVYYVDEQPRGVPGQGFAFQLWKGSLTLKAIEKGELLIMNKDDILKHYQENNYQKELPVAKTWVAVPIKSKNDFLGVITVQNYSIPNKYKEQDIDFLKSVSTQVAIAIERKSVNEQLKSCDNKYQNLIENINDAIYSTDFLGRVSYITPAIEQITGYHPNELNGKFRWYPSNREDLWSKILIHPDDRSRVEELVKSSIKTNTAFEVEYRIIKKDGRIKWISERGQLSKGNRGDIRLDGIILDIQEKKQAEQINKVLFSISNAVNTTFDLDELYKKIHESLGLIINVENFYIALYDKNKDIIFFPFDTDKTDKSEEAEVLDASKTSSLTAQLIRSGKPVLLSKEEQVQKFKKFGGKVYGTPSELWLGVPLKVKNEVIGAMVTQSYTNSNLYGEKEAAILVSVSDQIAIAIERKQSEEQLKRRELLITSLYNISNTIHTTSSLEQLYQSIHDSLKSIIDVKNFTIALYNKELDELSFKYSTDVVDVDFLYPIQNASKSSALTYEVIRLGEVLLLDEKGQFDMANKLSGKLLGTASKSWLGVPLKGKNEILGVIIIQNYTDDKCYKSRDIDLLTAVSTQIALAIEYKKSESELSSTQKLLIEKAHQAGMADVATDTLHNVGNLLNSVQTSGFIASDILKKSNLVHFQQANEVLKKQMDNLEEFFLSDPKGRKLLEYYLMLEGSFVEEQRDIQQHLDRLNHKIQIISNVIATQQNYAGINFLSEDHPLSGIVDDSLVMMDSILESNAITVTKDFKVIPTIKLQKTKLIHILINLIKNANDSLVEINEADKKIKLTIDSNKSEVFLKINDNGIGITKENLKKIFNHGFTTKNTGYGFGLHSCANYMAEMQGRMWAESEGTGKGATFVLEFPAIRVS